MRLYSEKIKEVRQNQEIFAKEGFTLPYIRPIMRKAWLDVWDSFHLFCQAKHIPDHGSYLEIGAWRGGSVLCAFLATKLAKISASFTVIDLGVDGAHFTEIMKQIPDIRFVLFRSDIAEDRIRNSSIDLLFIDGAHHYPQIKRDIINYWPKLKVGGILLGHDYSSHELHRGIVQAANEIFGKRLIRLKHSRIFKVKKISKELR